MRGSLWLATNSLCVPPRQALTASPPCPGILSSGHPSQPETAGIGRRLLLGPGDSSRNQGRNKTTRSWKENTIPAVPERVRRLQVLSCQQVDEGQLRPRLADARYLRGSVVQPGLEGTWSLGCPRRPHGYFGETIPSPPLSFFTSLAFASRHKPHSTGSPLEQSPQSAPSPAAILEKGRRYF